MDDIYKYDVVLFGMGINNGMAKGFSYEIGLNFPQVLISEGRYKYGDTRKFGTIHETECDGIIFVACYMSSVSKRKNIKKDFVDYESLDKCLKSIQEKYYNKKIGSYLLGCEEHEGDGDVDKLMCIFKKHFNDNQLFTLYLSKQRDFKAEMVNKIGRLYYSLKDGKITYEEYYNARRILEWRAKHGIYSEVPEDYVYTPKKRMKITYSKGNVIFK